MTPLHPVIIEWLNNPEKRNLIAKVRKAEGVVGQFGTITIKYVQGHVDKVTAESTVQEKI